MSMFTIIPRQILHAMLVILLLVSLLGTWLARPNGVWASGYMTWIDPGCYGPTTGYADPGFHR